jgi:hypothetical protein
MNIRYLAIHFKYHRIFRPHVVADKMEINWIAVGKVYFDKLPVRVSTIANAIVNAKFNKIKGLYYCKL